ncbi:MAG TPA: hypothetical protein VFV41_29345, partial [Streptosporangiaceae bacterium]|nr:hypothetical protein [Streptosporangiaceae bacterium]
MAGPRARRRSWPAVAGVMLAIVSLAVAAVAGSAVHSDLSRKPTAAQKSAAAAAAVARRWRTWPAGRIFPSTLGYST